MEVWLVVSEILALPESNDALRFLRLARNLSATSWGSALVATLVTASLPVTALALALTSLSGSMMRQWEITLALLLVLPIVTGIGTVCFLLFLISGKWHVHALVWLLWLAFSVILAVFCKFIVSKRIGLLRTPSGYEQWLKLAEERYRRARG